MQSAQVVILKCRVPIYDKERSLLDGFAAPRLFGSLSEALGILEEHAGELDFGDYRFSEDLDFSAVDAPREQALEETIREAVWAATKLLSAHGPFQIETARYTERNPHPGGQDAFIARVKFPWYPSPLCRIKPAVCFQTS